MDIVIAGASGLVGGALRSELEAQGHNIVKLVRRPTTDDNEARWDPGSGRLAGAILNGVDAVINLAGAGIGDKRWSTEYRRLLVTSRVDTTSVLARASAEADNGPSVFLGASAVGFYGNRGNEELTERSSRGDGFLADLCQGWKDAARPAAEAGIRTVALRSGIVLSAQGGVLPKFLPLFKLGVGGKFGSGAQYMSWISIVDEISAISYLLENADISGPVNLTAPNPATNGEFTECLADVLGRPAFVPVPRFGPRLLLGSNRADALLFEGQRVAPEVLTTNGFQFAHETLGAALRDVLDKR